MEQLGVVVCMKHRKHDQMKVSTQLRWRLVVQRRCSVYTAHTQPVIESRDNLTYRTHAMARSRVGGGGGDLI
jgi:hypothetical protein